jgi:hypothetical protein
MSASQAIFVQKAVTVFIYASDIDLFGEKVNALKSTYFPNRPASKQYRKQMQIKVYEYAMTSELTTSLE